MYRKDKFQNGGYFLGLKASRTKVYPVSSSDVTET
jgi:hypothetical protein